MSYTETEQLELSQQLVLECDLLDQRFAALKKSLVKPENKQKVIESYERLVKILRKEVEHIDKHGAALVPEIDFDDVRKNGGKLPDDFTKLVHERGCLILRNVVSEEQAVSWETSLKDYTKRHPGVGGHPHHKPGTLVIYPDRIRIRYPSNDPGQFPMDPHMDSGAIERWEDEENRKNCAAIFEGNWQDWDAWSADHRVKAQSDLYHTGTACSVWRSLQGWLSLSNTHTGEGTLRVLPSLKLSMAYIMLRPLFHTGEYKDSLPTFPGATPGQTQFFPTVEGHPDLDIVRAIVGIPSIRPGDYVFWHCDLVHGVDPTNPGLVDSSVSYNACNPLTPYNIESLLTTREAFQKGDVPIDFTRSHSTWEREYDHEDCGARVENILTKAGLQAMGLERLDTEEEGLTEGQKEVREMANTKLGL
ncbi:DUF1479 domain-containing protein [Fusarium phyllophilum]|uniref:DUF1479 domain-containing protein n=1 Tax=Fusarium phyllophilum TaxID=47803 RepID=A0A8H5NMK1_9HYPO|nr:DUF1479 domain-containing protein [Fusarium phyllophilum]